MIKNIWIIWNVANLYFAELELSPLRQWVHNLIVHYLIYFDFFCLLSTLQPKLTTKLPKPTVKKRIATPQSTPIIPIETPDLAPSSPESYSPRAQYSTPEVPSTTAPIDIITQNFRLKLLQTQRGNLTRLHWECNSNNNQPTNHVVFCLPICLTHVLSRFLIL